MKFITICFASLFFFNSINAAFEETTRRDRNSFMKVWGPAQRSASNNTAKHIVKEENNKPAQKINKREEEKKACIGNNIGAGNIFVWASKFSNTADYSTMKEDNENFENNVCFVKVDLKSSDERIKLPKKSKYFEMGQSIVCGSWEDKQQLTKLILDAKKTSRTWGTVAGAVGGAGIGVGAMELFGNKLIGGAVEGQKSLSDEELLKSQLLVLKKKNLSEFEGIKKEILSAKEDCSNIKSENDLCIKIESLYTLINGL